MTDNSKNSTSEAAPPQVKIRHKRWISVIWVVPIIAVIVTAYLAYGRFEEFGPTIAIHFKEGGGLRIGQTPLKYRGVAIGEVSAVGLTKDMQSVEVKIRLQRSAADVAREGSVFWIVSPEVGFSSITGLRTVLTGPEIDVLPGTGDKKTEFTGLDSAPVALEAKGLKITLRTTHLKSFLKPNTPVYYRGVEVGVVQDVALSSNATAADVHVLVREPYTKLVRGNSVFWDVSGASVHAGLFSGIDFRLESLRALATGGIAFATPSASAKPAKEGAMFPLYSGAPKGAAEWAPRIAVSAEE